MNHGPGMCIRWTWDIVSMDIEHVHVKIDRANVIMKQGQEVQ